VFRVEHFKDVPHFASKLAIENALREFDVPFTIIRPNYCSQNDATLKDALTNAGVYPMSLGQVGISAVDIRKFEKDKTAVHLFLEINRADLKKWECRECKSGYRIEGPDYHRRYQVQGSSDPGPWS
jgi:hypothetical protein